MTSVIAVAYAKHGRLHYADPGALDRPTPVTAGKADSPVSATSPADGGTGPSSLIGARVVVDLPAGPRVATVLWGPSDPLERVEHLPPVLRLATDHDEQLAVEAARRAGRARAVAKRAVRQRDLPMNVLGAEWIAADQRVTIWFSAPHRVDFRDLIRALNSELSMRVLLRQVNERERARIIGGVGVCGRAQCCSTFLDAFEPVTLQMARDQNLGSDPLRIAGACGRLMCCLRFEHPVYSGYTGRPPDGGCGHETECTPRVGNDRAHPRPGPR